MFVMICTCTLRQNSEKIKSPLEFRQLFSKAVTVFFFFLICAEDYYIQAGDYLNIFLYRPV